MVQIISIQANVRGVPCGDSKNSQKQTRSYLQEIFDIGKLSETSQHVGLAVKPRAVGDVQRDPRLRKYLLHQPGIKNVVDHPEVDPDHPENTKIILLDPDAVQHSDLSELPSEDSEIFFKSSPIGLMVNLIKTYSEMSYAQALRSVLNIVCSAGTAEDKGKAVEDKVEDDQDKAEAVEDKGNDVEDKAEQPSEVDKLVIPNAFETVGHIAHFNLTDSMIPYAKYIAAITLDKHPQLKTVVRKSRKLHSVFRECPYEVIGGDASAMEAKVSENGFTFKVRYDKVFWNSRLVREREAVSDLVPQKSIILDAMGGVGGFGCYLARRKNCFIFSSDLNPAAVEDMRDNFISNRVQDKCIEYNMSADDFIKKMFSMNILDASEDIEKIQKAEREQRDKIETGSKKRKIPAANKKTKKRKIDSQFDDDDEDEPEEPICSKIFVLMNLPDSSFDFLKAFTGCIEAEKVPASCRDVTCICYCFVPVPREEENQAQWTMAHVKGRLVTAFGLGDDSLCPEFELREVRDVAPNKLMYAVHIHLGVNLLSGSVLE